MATSILAMVLDVDGTLVDSNEQHARAWCEALERLDLPAPFAAVRRLIGMGGDKLVPRMTGFASDTDLGEEISRARRDIFRSRYLPTIEPFEGAREMVERMRGAGLAIAIASSADKPDLMELLEIARVADLVEEHASSADAEESKPDPDIVRAALAKLRVPAEQVLMVGDTPYDIEAAGLAGLRTIAFRCGGGWTDDDLVGALEIRDGPWDLAEQLSRRPEPKEVTR